MVQLQGCSIIYLLWLTKNLKELLLSVIYALVRLHSTEEKRASNTCSTGASVFLFRHRKERAIRIFLIVEKDNKELVGPKGFYPKRGFQEYTPTTRNKSNPIIREYVEECQDGYHLLLLNNVFSTSHEANCFKEMETVADAAQARVYPKGD